jgi:hypothetical protein
MAMPTARSDQRITKEMAVELVRPHASQFKETAMAQNVSARGMPVATEQVWRPGDPMLLSSPESDFRAEVRVVYYSGWKTTDLLSVWNSWPSREKWTKPH